MNEIENNLKILRLNKKLTQQQLADELNKQLIPGMKPISKMNISNWENGKHTIKLDNAEKLAKYFDVSVPYLLGFKDYDLDLDGNFIKNNLPYYDFTFLNILDSDTHCYFGLKLSSKVSEENLYTGGLLLLNESLKTVFLLDMNKDKFFNFIADSNESIPSAIQKDIEPQKVIAFSTYIKYRTKEEPDSLKQIIFHVFGKEKMENSNYKVEILELQKTESSSINLDD